MGERPAVYGEVADASFDAATSMMRAAILREAQQLASLARLYGLVLTIEQVSQKPLASGNHIDVVTVRPARKAGGQY